MTIFYDRIITMYQVIITFLDKNVYFCGIWSFSCGEYILDICQNIIQVYNANLNSSLWEQRTHYRQRMEVSLLLTLFIYNKKVCKTAGAL